MWGEWALNGVMAKHRDADSCPAWPPSASDRSEPAIPSADLARLAWEFLRRSPTYRRDYAQLQAGALSALPGRWGLKRAVDPDEAGVDGAAIWRAND